MSLPEHGRVLFVATLVRGHILKFHVPYLRWFQEHGWETWVAACEDRPVGERGVIPFCDRFVNIGFARGPFSRNNLNAYRELRDLFARERFDIVSAHTPVGGVLARLAARDARRAGAKLVYTAHGLHFYDGAPAGYWLKWYPMERLMSHFCDVLVTINQEDYARARRFAHCRVEYAPGVGVDLKRFRQRADREGVRARLGLVPGDFALLSVGDLIPRKNQRVIIEAIGLLPDDVRLLICGEGPDEERLLRLARELGVMDRIAFLGFRSDMDELMSSCDALVLPSVQEGLPVSVMEAMACGLPAIASEIRGIVPDLIEPGRSGLVVKDPDAADIAHMITRLRGDPALAASLVVAARQDVRRFSIDNLIKRYGEIYESLF